MSDRSKRLDLLLKSQDLRMVAGKEEGAVMREEHPFAPPGEVRRDPLIIREVRELAEPSQTRRSHHGQQRIIGVGSHDGDQRGARSRMAWRASMPKGSRARAGVVTPFST